MAERALGWLIRQAPYGGETLRFKRKVLPRPSARKQKIYHVQVLAFCKFSCLIALEQCDPEEFSLRLEQIQMQLQDMKRQLLNGVSHIGKKHTSTLESSLPPKDKDPMPCCPGWPVS